MMIDESMHHALHVLDAPVTNQQKEKPRKSTYKTTLDLIQNTFSLNEHLQQFQLQHMFHGAS